MQVYKYGLANGLKVPENGPDMEPHRCPWAKGDNYIQYHDTEWGVPVHDDRLLFEQAVGMVNDHLVDCFRHRELARKRHGKTGR